MPLDTLGERGQFGAVLIPQHDPRRARLADRQREPGHPGPRAGQRVEDAQRPLPAGRGRRAGRAGRARQVPGRRGPGRGAAFPGLPPPGQQVEVNLVALGAGDGVVVRAVGELPPGLVDRLRRVGRAGQPGQRGQPLAVQAGDLGGPLGLLGVDVGDVLAGVDRVHVAGLRRDPRPGRGGVRPDGAEEVSRHRGDEPRPDVAVVPVPVDLRHPARRDHVVGTDRQQHVAGRGDLGQRPELVVGLGLRGGQVRQPLHGPARAVVVGHVGGEQAVAVRRHPLELAGELHPRVPALGARRAPLVERPARPRRGGQAGRRHQARIPRVMPEDIEHPAGPRVPAQHVALEPDPEDGVADRGLGPGEVGVRLVVRAAHQLDPAVGDEAPQVGAVFGEGVEVRLEVVDLGQHELVVRVFPGLFQVQVDQLERGPHVRDRAVGVRQEQAGLGELALGAPPEPGRSGSG